MLQFLVEQLNEHLASHGTIVDVLLRSDQSLVEEQEIREVILTFAEEEQSEEQSGKPLATIHLFELEEAESCEVEVEVEFTGERTAEGTRVMWEQARALIPKISLTEKKRYLEPGQSVQTAYILDYHFILESPKTEAEASQFARVLKQFSSDLGKLVRLS